MQVHACAQGLRVYLLAYGAFYHSLSQDQLAAMFDLPAKEVHAVVSKMMMDEDLAGSWDQPTATIVMHASNPSRLQVLTPVPVPLCSALQALLWDGTAPSCRGLLCAFLPRGAALGVTGCTLVTCIVSWRISLVRMHRGEAQQVGWCIRSESCDVIAA
jgi:hypothetical protein